MSSNLPPGVTEAMIPGNRPEDEEWERLYDYIDEVCAAHNINPKEAKMCFDIGLNALRLDRLLSEIV